MEMPGRRRMHFERHAHIFHRPSPLTVDEQEALEQIYQSTEKDEVVTSSAIMSHMHIPHLGGILHSLVHKGLVSHVRRGFVLSEKGKEEAVRLVRRNRLAEVLFTQAFDLPYSKAVDIACKFEHLALSDDVTDSICTFLGHPPQSPDGRPIPPGECCKEKRKELVPIVKKLTELKVGETGRVVFIAPGSHSLLDKLSSFGIVPGEEIRIHQTSPSLVIQFAFTTMALEDEVAQYIYVRVRMKEE